MPKDVFELVELTPEMYFSQGVFVTLSDAIDAIKSDYPHCKEASETIDWEVRKRTIGSIGHGNDVVIAKVTYDSILESLQVKYF